MIFLTRKKQLIAPAEKHITLCPCPFLFFKYMNAHPISRATEKQNCLEWEKQKIQEKKKSLSWRGKIHSSYSSHWLPSVIMMAFCCSQLTEHDWLSLNMPGIICPLGGVWHSQFSHHRAVLSDFSCEDKLSIGVMELSQKVVQGWYSYQNGLRWWWRFLELREISESLSVLFWFH